MRSSLAVAAVAAFLYAASFVSATQTTCTPDDIECIFRSAQYTLYGTVAAITKADSKSKYNATVAVECAYLSFSSPVSDAADIVGDSVLVVGFGPSSGCPSSYPSADVVAGNSYVFFLYVNNTAAQGEQKIYGVYNPCGGPQNWTSTYAQDIANDIVRYPSNAITTANPTSVCPTLPTAESTVTQETSSPTVDPNTVFGNAARANDVYVLGLTAFLVIAGITFSVFGVFV